MLPNWEFEATVKLTAVFSLNLSGTPREDITYEQIKTMIEERVDDIFGNYCDCGYQVLLEDVVVEKLERVK